MARSESDEALKAPNSAADIRPERHGRRGHIDEPTRRKRDGWPSLLAARSSHYLAAALPSRAARFRVKAFELIAAPAGVGGSKLQDSQLRDSPALGP
jgi:hypothetical protein